MNQIVENLLKKPEPRKRFYRVVKPLAGNRYQVRDSSGRVVDVEATKRWSAGDGVTVSNGWIVGMAARFINPKVYEV